MFNFNLYNQSLFEFLALSPTPFHAVRNIENHLINKGYIRLQENERWQLTKGQSFFITREGGAFVAFTLGIEEEIESGIRVLAAHTDSPCLQIKPWPMIKTNSYLQLGVEVYGGSLLSTWFDRDLSLAGRVCCRMGDGGIGAILVNFRRPLLIIPSLALHLDREINASGKINQQKHLPPVFSQAIDQQLPDFKSLLFDQIRLEHEGISVESILTFDMFCYDVQPPAYSGARNEFISSGRLDNLLSCHAGMTAMGKPERTKNSLFFCTNHEETGSLSSAGAHSSFLESMLERIIPDSTARRIALSNSFMISMDNAHATHPNFLEKTDSFHEIHLNKGPVIKFNANQRYATNSLSAAVYKQICAEVEIAPQEFVMRSDLPCGSTIGPIASARLGLRTVDIGAASLAMHSIREHTGALDPYLLFKSIEQFLKSDTHNLIGY